MKTTLEIPDDLYRQVKVHAAQENRKMKDLVSEGLRLVLRLPKKASTAKPHRITEAPVTIPEGHAIRHLSNDQMAEMFALGQVWGVTPEEAIRRVVQTARDANASRKKALTALEKIRRHPPYPPGRVQEMIDEANRLRKESWD